MSTFILYQGQTIDAVQTEIFIGGSVGERVLVPTNNSVAFWGNMLARNSTPDASKHWRFKGLVKNEGDTVSSVELIDMIIVAEDSGALLWDMAVEADDTNDSIAVKVTGEAATTISWECKLYLIET